MDVFGDIGGAGTLGVGFGEIKLSAGTHFSPKLLPVLDFPIIPDDMDDVIVVDFGEEEEGGLGGVGVGEINFFVGTQFITKLLSDWALEHVIFNLTSFNL